MIDLRSDTVTKPTKEMRAAMAGANVGDDVYGEDPSVNALQTYCSNLLRKEAALYCPSGTQSNLIALLTHCGRGDEYIVGNQAHTYKYEGGGAAVLGSIQPQPIELTEKAVMPLEALKAAIKPDDIHFAKSRLVCLENTYGGRVMPLDHPAEIRTICDQYGLSLHLDGARLFNAVVKTGETASDLTKDFDTVSICLSKGLGAPMGSVLVGSQDFIEKAKHWRKMLGGGMRQAGMMAAGGLFALKNQVDRLLEDHQNAECLAEGLQGVKGVEVDIERVETNMVFVNVDQKVRDQLDKLASLTGLVLPTGLEMRLVLHLDITREDVEKVIEIFHQASRK